MSVNCWIHVLLQKVLAHRGTVSLHGLQFSATLLRWCLCNFASPLFSSMTLNASIPKKILYIAHIHSPEDSIFRMGVFPNCALWNRTRRASKLLFFPNGFTRANDFTWILIWMCEQSTIIIAESWSSAFNLKIKSFTIYFMTWRLYYVCLVFSLWW